MKPKTQTQQTKRNGSCNLIGSSLKSNNRLQTVVGNTIELKDTPRSDKTAENQEVKSLRKDAPANVDALDKYESSPDLSSQLNTDYFWDNWKYPNDFTGKKIEDLDNVIKETIRLATAKALYNEKKKTLSILREYKAITSNLGSKPYVEIQGFKPLKLLKIRLSKKIEKLESEIKQIENEVPEVKE